MFPVWTVGFSELLQHELTVESLRSLGFLKCQPPHKPSPLEETLLSRSPAET